MKQSLLHLSIGDTEHFVCPDRHQWAIAQSRRGTIRKSASSVRVNGATNQARVIMREAAGQTHRRTDKTEQAKLYLQRRGLRVFSAEVIGGPKALYVVSGRPDHLTKAELRTFAKQRGWQG